jgi:hypothetical protein
MKARMFMVLLVAACVMVAGCNTHNQTKLDMAKELTAVTSDASLATTDVEGNQQAAYHGVGPTQLKQDAEGNWAQMPGPVGVMSAPMPGTDDKLAYIISPNDTKIARISYTPNPSPGQPMVELEGIEANISTPLAQHVIGIEKALTALTTMTKTEAEARIRQLEIAGEITSDMAAKLVQLLPLLITP